MIQRWWARQREKTCKPFPCLTPRPPGAAAAPPQAMLQAMNASWDSPNAALPLRLPAAAQLRDTLLWASVQVHSPDVPLANIESGLQARPLTCSPRCTACIACIASCQAVPGVDPCAQPGATPAPRMRQTDCLDRPRLRARSWPRFSAAFRAIAPQHFPALPFPWPHRPQVRMRAALDATASLSAIQRVYSQVEAAVQPQQLPYSHVSCCS
jgi:hypothetical protein